MTFCLWTLRPVSLRTSSILMLSARTCSSVITPDPASLTDSYATVKVLSKETGRRDFQVIVNMVKDEKEALDMYKKILLVTDRFLNISLDFAGYIPVDKNVNIAVKKQKLWAETFPETQATKALVQICNRLVA